MILKLLRKMVNLHTPFLLQGLHLNIRSLFIIVNFFIQVQFELLDSLEALNNENALSVILKVVLYILLVLISSHQVVFDIFNGQILTVQVSYEIRFLPLHRFDLYSPTGRILDINPFQSQFVSVFQRLTSLLHQLLYHRTLFQNGLVIHLAPTGRQLFELLIDKSFFFVVAGNS